MAENEKETLDTAGEVTEEVTETPAEPEKAEQPARSEKTKKEKKKMSAAAQKRLKYGTVATAITCVAVAATVVLNLLVSRLVEKYPLKLDLTESGMYEISQESIDYLRDLGMDVNFTVLMDESNFQTSGTTMKMVSELLEKYAQYSDHVKLSYVDPATNPDVVNTYQSGYSGTLTEGDIIVSDAADPTKMRVVSMGSLFSYDQQKYAMYYYYGQGSLEDAITGFSGEQNLTAALMYVTDADPVRAAVIATANGEPIYNAGYNAYSLAIFTQTLTKNGYDVQTVDMYTDTLDPETYDLVILPAPVNDLTAAAIDSISAFLYNGGTYDKNLIYIADFTQGDTPNLDELLATWGIEVTKNLAIEGNESSAQQVSVVVGGSAVPMAVPTATVADDAYLEGMVNTSLPIVAPLCRTINFLWEERSGGMNAAVLQTSDTVYLNEMGSETENADKTPAGAQNVLTVTSRKEIIDNIYHTSNIMVLGSMMLTDYNVMQDASYNNAPFLMNAVNLITGKGTGLVIAEKQLTSQSLTMTTGDMRGGMLAVFAVPALVVAIGIVVISRRRNK